MEVPLSSKIFKTNTNSIELLENNNRNYCIYNAIKTPDGTILWCQDSHDYQEHLDTVSGEKYLNDGLGLGIRRSVNKVPYEDLSVWSNDPFEKIRTAPFWGSYGKDGKSPKKMMAPCEMEDSHLRAILETQKRIAGTEIEKIFIKEIEYRIKTFKNTLDEDLPTKEKKAKKPKV